MGRTEQRAKDRNIQKSLKKDLGKDLYSKIMSDATRILIDEEITKAKIENDKNYWKMVQGNLMKAMRELRVSEERCMRIFKRVNELNNEVQ